MKRLWKKRPAVVLCLICGLFLYACYAISAQQVYAAEQQKVRKISEETNPRQESEKNPEQNTENSDENTPEIPVQELDLGDYTTTMEAGERQLLTVTVLPMDASDKQIQYKSSNEAVATINGMGRITAISPGTTEVVISCGGVEARFSLTVKEKTEEQKQEVTDIEISNDEDTVEVDKTLILSVAVIPADVEDNTISYSTSDASVATVNHSGTVKGIAPGTVTITVKAGNIVKEIPLRVKVGTTMIQLNQAYVILKKGETFKLEAAAVPQEASQAMEFKSTDLDVAEVSGDGFITAKEIGTATILVSNEDMSNAVTVIVNSEKQQEVENEDAGPGEVEDISLDEKRLLAQLAQDDTVYVSMEDCRKLSKNVLKYLQKENKTVVIESDFWVMTVDGGKIVNYQNELWTDIMPEKEDGKTTFVLNNGENLPGTVSIQIVGQEDYLYTYLYNAVKEQYELINQSEGKLVLDIPGEYLLTKEKIGKSKLNFLFLGVGGIMMIGLGIGFVLVKRRYWFW